MLIEATEGGFTLSVDGRVVARHSRDCPFVSVGHGEATMAMYRGNFDISDDVVARGALDRVEIDGEVLRFSGDVGWLEMAVVGDALEMRGAAAGLNRFWFRLHAEAGERVWGCGEQMSYLNLRGRVFPLWTSEPGVGRDKSTAITRLADETGHAGGDYFTTNYPQPTFLSSRFYAAHVETTAYSVFDFRADDFHELQTWALPDRIAFHTAPDLLGLVEKLSASFGRPPRLPDWVMRGAIIGLKQGAASFDLLESYLDAGVEVSALWCEDWTGTRETSFGTRLFWDWRWNPTRYPALPERIAALRARGIRFLGYVNPYLCVDGTLFPEAERLGLLALHADGVTYRVDFGEFDCGVVDFTQPEACAWFSRRVLRENMLGIGMAGWMADFGEYLPVDAKLADGDAVLLHNAWPTMWAKVNAETSDDALFFMRAGFTGLQRHNRLLWAGDQSVDFSRHDGLRTVITGALSSGLLGNPYHHSDIGGYTSQFGNVRTLELLQRWTEMAAFTPVMRTHEGNRPGENLQFHQSPEAMVHLARMVRVHTGLLPVFQALADEAVARGLPMQRPLFLHFPDDARAAEVEDAYLLGADLLVAPVHAAGATHWPVYLPAGADWVHLWSGIAYAGGQEVSVAAPIGEPPVFHRQGAAFDYTALRDAD